MGRSRTKLPRLPSTVATRSRRTANHQLNALIVDSIQDIKGKKIVSIDLRGIEDAPADFFIICEAESTVQVRAIADNVRRRVRTEAQERAAGIEGIQASKWVCVDFFSTVVHIFNPEARSFYDLEGLWSDAPTTRYADA